MIKAVFFDMDGTITQPFIDWVDLRRRAKIPDGQQIMPYIDSLPPKAGRHALTAVESTEMEAARAAELNPGARELLCELRSRGLNLALITNNHRTAMHVVVEKFELEFDLLLSREDAPLKPAPDLLYLALERLSVKPVEACFVGDGRYDRMASETAGVRYIHLSHQDDTGSESGSTIRSLTEIWSTLDLNSEVASLAKETRNHEGIDCTYGKANRPGLSADSDILRSSI